MTMINFEEWANIEMRVGEVKDILKEESIITCKNKDFSTKIKLNAKKNDLIVIGFFGDEIIIPLVNDNILLSPENESAEPGMRIG
jgi:hypothetical protein